MGVFARLFRRSTTAEEASAAESRAGTPVPENAADESAAGTDGPAGAEETAPAVAGTREAADSESVGIPRQQSTGEAVDNEADKGART
ncbi:hypothetical protein AB0E77_31185 [Streptomyces sp. NPDC032940]|uniref:hypothetical protein n=1 Tax=Streptomyces sp. NPDC032940 TaxID=3155366 RepID=UPI0033DF9ABC